MADITMCSGFGCNLRENCYRHNAKPSYYRQAYFLEPPYSEETGTCDHYWPMKGENDG